jgi:hypothetical protein
MWRESILNNLLDKAMIEERIKIHQFLKLFIAVRLKRYCV